MRESINGAWLIGIIMTFMAVFIAYTAISLNYSNAFLMRTQMITIIEQYEGINNTLSSFPEDTFYDVYTAQEEGIETELIYCSADTDSLDAVMSYDGKIVAADATLPHAAEPKYPGRKYRFPICLPPGAKQEAFPQVRPV